MANCPHCGYEGAPTDFVFESIRVDSRENRASDRGVVCCPDCKSVLGGYTFKRAPES